MKTRDITVSVTLENGPQEGAQGQTPTQMPGRAENAANPAPYTKSGMFCRHCHTGYRHTDAIGCCSACRRCFKGLTAFDRHQSIENGRTVCDVTKTRKDGSPVFEATDDGRGPLWRMVPTGTNPWAGEDA